MSEIGAASSTRGSGATAGELLELLRTGKAVTRTDLRRITGLSRTAVVSRVDALVGSGLVVPGGELESTGGRRPGSVVFDHKAGLVGSAAIGRSRSQVALFDLAGTELGAAAVEHEVGAGPDAVMPDVARQLSGLRGDHPGRIFGVGVSIPGSVDPDRGVSVDSPVMAGWDGVELAPYLREVADAPLFVGNDADVLARSERLGHAAKHRNLIVVKASTGLGLGILAD